MNYKVLTGAFSVLLASCLFIGAPAYGVVNENDLIGEAAVGDSQIRTADLPDVTCEAGMVVTSDGRVLWSRNADEKRSIASLTKMMTALVVIENCSVDETVEITEEATDVGGSTCELVPDTEANLGDLLTATLIVSGNDGATALAIHCAGSVDAFVNMMNEEAAKIGMANTHFTNPHGLDDEDHYSSARDIMLLERTFMDNDFLAAAVDQQSVDLDLGDGEKTFETTDWLMNTYEPVKGIKTGWTDDAGKCLASYAELDGVELFSIVLGCEEEYLRFSDAQQLLSWGFANYKNEEIVSKGEDVGVIENLGGTSSFVGLSASSDLTKLIFEPDGNISKRVTINNSEEDIHAGDVMGVMRCYQGDALLGSVNLVATQNWDAPDRWDRLGAWFKELWNDITPW